MENPTDETRDYFFFLRETRDYFGSSRGRFRHIRRAELLDATGKFRASPAAPLKAFSNYVGSSVWGMSPCVVVFGTHLYSAMSPKWHAKQIKNTKFKGFYTKFE
jgi:hypothetical protein